MSNLSTINQRNFANESAPISRALALGTSVDGALALVESCDAARREIEFAANERRLGEFFVGLDVAELKRASAALLEGATDIFESRKCAAMFSLVLDSLPSALNFSSETYTQVLAGLIDTDEAYEINWHPDGHAPDTILSLRGYSRVAVSRAMRRLLMTSQFAPAPANVMEALACARSALAHGHIKAERLLAQRRRILERDRLRAKAEKQFAGRDRNEVIAELRNAPSAPNPFTERARQAKAEERKRWRRILAGELNPFAHLVDEDVVDSSVDGSEFDDCHETDPEALAAARMR